MHSTRFLGLALGAALTAIAPVAAAQFTVGSGGAYTTIQGAIDAATLVTGGHEVRVRAGSYVENLVISSLGSAASLTLSGGWNASFSSRDTDPAQTTVDGGAAARVLDVTAFAGELVVEGFTLRNGSDGELGAGVAIVSGSSATLDTTIRDCAISSNQVSGTSSAFGGGLHASLLGPGTLVIEDCEISVNSAESTTANVWGGGVFLVVNSTASATIRGCDIHDNTVTSPNGVKGAGAISAATTSAPELPGPTQ